MRDIIFLLEQGIWNISCEFFFLSISHLVISSFFYRLLFPCVEKNALLASMFRYTATADRCQRPFGNHLALAAKV